MPQPSWQTFRLVLTAEADSVIVARKQLRSQIPTGSHYSANVVSEGGLHTKKAVAETTDGALAKARSGIPDNAVVTAQRQLAVPAQQSLTMEAFDEDTVRSDIAERDGIVRTLRLSTPGRSGFLGVGKKANRYEVTVFQQAVVEVTYTTPAKVSATVRGRGEMAPFSVI